MVCCDCARPGVIGARAVASIASTVRRECALHVEIDRHDILPFTPAAVGPADPGRQNLSMRDYLYYALITRASRAPFAANHKKPT